MTHDTNTLWLSLELDPGTADFYGLPPRLSIPDDSGGPFLGGYNFEASLTDLAASLERAAELNLDLDGRVDILRFVHRWPRYAELDRYLRMGNATFARTVARSLLSNDRFDPPPLATLALLEAQEGNWEAAIEFLDRLLERAPTHSPSRLHVALSMAGAGHREEALQRLEDLALLPRTESLARFWRYAVAGGDEESLSRRLREHMQNMFGVHGQMGSDALWETLIEEFPENPEVLVARTFRPGGSKDDAEREMLLRRALQSDPGHVVARTALAGVYRRFGRPEEALATLDGAPDGEFPLLLAVRGQTLEQLGRGDEATEAYQGVFEGTLALIPGSSLLIAGEGLLRRAPVHEARRMFEDAVEARPGDSLPHQLLARLDETRGDGVESAERRLREAIKSCGPVPLLQYALGDMLRRSDRLVEAEGLFKVLVRRHPRSSWGHRGLGDLAVEQEPVRALDHYAKAIEIDPMVPIAGFDYLAGITSLRAGDLDTARNHLFRAVAAEPGNARYWCDLGAVDSYRGDLDGAMGATERALILEPGHPGFQYNLAQYHQARFREQPLRHLGSAWKAWKLRRSAAGASGRGWRRELWEPEIGQAKGAPRLAGPESSTSSPHPPKDDN
jgi:tetratricopeptide (TPR) repeat protein